jgi:hypothetical protein
MREVASRLPTERSCTCGQALESAIITEPEYIGNEARERLAAIIGNRIPKAGEAAGIPVGRR